MARRNSQPNWLIAAGILVIGLFTFLSRFQADPSFQNKNPLSDPISVTGNVEIQSGGEAGSKTPKQTIRIASFNIQVFGQSKLSKKQIAQRLAQIVTQFDIVAVQEIRSKDQSLMPEFVGMINSRGSKYDFLISPRLGRTSSKEQYAFLYRTSTVKPIPESSYMINDPQDLIHREPFVASFQAVSEVKSKQPFTFTLINIHTDPDEAEFEVAQLADVYRSVAEKNPQEDDIFILGDLNVNAGKLSALTRIPVLDSVLEEVPTNTRGTRQYDHIILNRNSTTEFTGKGGVFHMETRFGLSREQALELSDHEPIWAEFSTQEQPGPSRLTMPAIKTIIR